MSELDRIMVVGLGGIGASMASRLVDREWEVSGLEPYATRRDDWAAATGRPVYASPEDPEVWDGVTKLLITVRTEAQVLDVLDRAAVQATQRLVVYVVSTVRPSFWNEITARIPKEWRLVECPVTGGEGPARRGEIAMLLANHTQEDLPLVADLTGKTAEFDSLGQPALVKLLNNSLAAMNAANLSRCVAFAQRNGVQSSEFRAALELGSGRSMVSAHLANLSSNQFDLLEKDAGLLLEDHPDAPIGDVQQLAILVRDALGDDARTGSVL